MIVACEKWQAKKLDWEKNKFPNNQLVQRAVDSEIQVLGVAIDKLRTDTQKQIEEVEIIKEDEFGKP